MVSSKNSNFVKLVGGQLLFTFYPYKNNEQNFIEIVLSEESATGAQARIRLFKDRKSIQFVYREDRSVETYLTNWTGTLT